jgi:hypothetical protein
LAAVSVEDRIERIDAVETLVRARLRLGELDAAGTALDELETSARVIPTDASAAPSCWPAPCSPGPGATWRRRRGRSTAE